MFEVTITGGLPATTETTLRCLPGFDGQRTTPSALAAMGAGGPPRHHFRFQARDEHDLFEIVGPTLRGAGVAFTAEQVLEAA